MAREQIVSMVRQDAGYKMDRIEQAPTFWATIFMSGPIEQAKQICRQYCLDVGLCVTIEPTLYIYTGGEESGFRVGLINYPRFPASPALLQSHAEELAEKLRDALCQHSYTIMTPKATVWNTSRESSIGKAGGNT